MERQKKSLQNRQIQQILSPPNDQDHYQQPGDVLIACALKTKSLTSASQDFHSER